MWHVPLSVAVYGLSVLYKRPGTVMSNLLYLSDALFSRKITAFSFGRSQKKCSAFFRRILA